MRGNGTQHNLNMWGIYVIISQHGACEGFMWFTSLENWTRHTTINSTMININWMDWKSQRRYVFSNHSGRMPHTHWPSLIWICTPCQSWYCSSRSTSTRQDWTEDQAMVGSKRRRLRRHSKTQALGLLALMLSASRSQLWLGMLTPSKSRPRMWRCRRGVGVQGHHWHPLRSRQHRYTCDRTANHCWAAVGNHHVFWSAVGDQALRWRLVKAWKASSLVSSKASSLAWCDQQ